MKSKIWMIGWLAIVLLIAGSLGYWVYKVDPFMHYRKPDTSTYYYLLNNERSQNDGIVKHFDYDALITGTSMTQNFKTSEMDRIFGCSSIKVPFSGGSYREINDNLKSALSYNSNIKTIVRGLDTDGFLFDKDTMHFDLSKYPTYLYDANPINDIKYLLSRDVIWDRVYKMIRANNNSSSAPGITSFDDYVRWQQFFTFGINTVLPDGITEFKAGEPIHLTIEEKEIIKGNIDQNVTSLANEYSEVDFYYFFPPYSIVWWQSLVESGEIYKQIEAEQYVIELILKSDNIRLFSFNNRFDITTDLNNYKDSIHYGAWVNSFIFKWMYDGQYQLNKENYQDYLKREMEYYTSFDYMSLNKQEDYENNYYVAALHNEELTEAVPISISLEDSTLELKNAEIVENQYNGERGIKCIGTLQRKNDYTYSIEDSLREENYIGCSTTLDIACEHRYLVFYGKKLADRGQPTVMLFDEHGSLLADVSTCYNEIDGAWHQYILDVSNLCGTVKMVFNGGYIDDTGNDDSSFIFSDICLY